MRVRCLCLCHDTEIDIHLTGVLTSDALEAAVSCNRCRNDHVLALLEPRERIAPRPTSERSTWNPAWGDAPTS